MPEDMTTCVAQERLLQLTEVALREQFGKNALSVAMSLQPALGGGLFRARAAERDFGKE